MKPFKISATTIKNWFQYRCERKAVYECIPSELAEAVPIIEDRTANPWATFGRDFEDNVVAELVRRYGRAVLSPPNKDDALTEREVNAFLRRQDPTVAIAHQIVLEGCDLLRTRLGVGNDVAFRKAKPDLILATDGEGGPTLRIVDIKATPLATPFHKAQVAFYAIALRALMDQGGLQGRIDPVGEIWTIPESGDGSGVEWRRIEFKLKGYEALVTDFFHREVRRMATRTVSASKDDTFFHIYHKCEACKYMPHCRRSISSPLPTDAWDVSAVPGTSHESKRALHHIGIFTVGELAHASNLPDRQDLPSWALRTRAQDLVARAGAMLDGAIKRMPERYTYLMPPKADVAIGLAVDRNPVDDRLAAIGCHIVRPGMPPEVVVQAVEDPIDEVVALKRVLGAVLNALVEVDQANRARQALQAHLYLYEPSEAQDLQAAIGRHLKDETVLAGLLELVRIFPPEQVVPEPEYRGVHHLPATAVRSVVSGLYALPIPVSYDLQHVTQVLATATPPLAPAYRPVGDFAHDFSSRLAIRISHDLRSAKPGAREAAEADMAERLAALDGLRVWIEADNARAAEPFLRLNKAPFMFQATVAPIDAPDLDVLLAHELLESRSKLLATLVDLARPAIQRRDRLRCYAHMTLKGAPEVESKFVRLHFIVPEASRMAELSSSTFALLLHDDSPDIRLHHAMWRAFKVKIEDADNQRADELIVKVDRDVFDGEPFQTLLTRNKNGHWFLDEVINDVNTDKIVRFLRYLAGGS